MVYDRATMGSMVFPETDLSDYFTFTGTHSNYY